MSGLTGECTEDDMALMCRIKSGDSSAFEAIYAHYHRMTIDIAFNILGERELAREVCQECFLKLLKNPPPALKDNSLGGWLNVVARNCALDVLRHRNHDDAECPDVGEIPSEVNLLREIVSTDDARVVRGLMERLPEEYRCLVKMRFYDNCTFAVMAERCGIPIGTALWRLNHALGLLQQYYQEENK